MAALAEIGPAELLNLRRLRGADLRPLLQEEAQRWRQVLHWDFAPSAALIERYLDMQALGGYALWAGGRIRGYCYFVVEDRKALVGDLFVDDSLATPLSEQRLLDAVLADAWLDSSIRRVEAQLMMKRYPAAGSGGRVAIPFERHFMAARLDSLPPIQSSGVEIHAWTEARQDECARLIAECYEHHVDSDINDQYLSVAGTRRFLTNIVAYPGCGTFSRPASLCAIDRQSGRLAGLSFASEVAPQAGHITQLCVAPGYQGQGVGRELLRSSLRALKWQGCREVSLTVTAANANAVRLYRREGFETLRDFTAYVWKRPG